jgi:hypothetical protein
MPFNHRQYFPVTIGLPKFAALMQLNFADKNSIFWIKCKFLISRYVSAGNNIKPFIFEFKIVVKLDKRVV